MLVRLRFVPEATLWRFVAQTDKNTSVWWSLQGPKYIGVLAMDNSKSRQSRDSGFYHHLYQLVVS